MTDRKQIDLAALDGVSGGRPSGEGYPTQGDDALDGRSHGEAMAGLGGNDHLYGHGGNDTITGGAGVDRVNGGDGDDLLSGGAGVDVVNGGEGNDTVVWRPGEGADQLQGDGGFDVLKLEETGLTLEQMRQAITLEDGSRPLLEDGKLLLHGQAGSLTINGETIRFAGFEQVIVSEDSPYMYGR